MGASAGDLETFVVGKLHLIQSAVLRLLNFFPTDQNATYNSAEYNRLTHQEYDHIQDFHALHYHLASAVKTDFWKMVDVGNVPERLVHKLDLFKRRGAIPFYEGETLSAGIWMSFMFGNNVWPERCDPLIAGMDQSWIKQQLDKMKQVTDDAAKAMPSQSEYLEKIFLERR